MIFHDRHSTPIMVNTFILSLLLLLFLSQVVRERGVKWSPTLCLVLSPAAVTGGIMDS
jgi:hypothetical protein